MASINRSHIETDGGILLFNGEFILIYSSAVSCEIIGRGSLKGRVFLTTHRLVIIVDPYKQNAPIKSFSVPFSAIVKCSVEQPIFGANYIEATVSEDGDPSKKLSFRMKFSKGGAIEMAMTMNRAVARVGQFQNSYQSEYQNAPPPAYTPSPTAQYYQAPPTVYAPGYNCGIQVPHQQFPEQPPIGFIYASSAPPPYPGLNTQTGQQQYPQAQQQQYPQPQPQQPYPSAGNAYPVAPQYQPQTNPGNFAPQNPQPQPQQQQPSSGAYPFPQQQSYEPYQQAPTNSSYVQPGASSVYPAAPNNSGATSDSSINYPSAPAYNPNWNPNDKK